MSSFDAPVRKEYIRRQKEIQGRHPLGVFPAVYPKEILWAMNILPVEIWDPPVSIVSGHAHLQPYICSIVMQGLELILQGKCTDLEGYLFPHTCDSIQNLASVVNDTMGLDKPCFFFYLPKAPFWESSRAYYLSQLKELISKLEGPFGPLDPNRLPAAVKLGQKISSIIGDLYGRRSRRELAASNVTFYQVIRQGEFLHPEDFLPLLERFSSGANEPIPQGPGIVLSGILPGPAQVLSLLDEKGLPVLEDDLLNCSRRLLVPPPRESEPPLEALTTAYLGMPPCSTRTSSLEDRLNTLLQKVERSKAQGVIFNVVKFCEPELFDLPGLREGLKNKGIPHMVLEYEVNQPPGGQVATRIEAFIETLK